MRINDKVRLVQPVIEGEVKDTQYNKGEECLEHLVEWKDKEGEVHQRWFLVSELEEVK